MTSIRSIIINSIITFNTGGVNGPPTSTSFTVVPVNDMMAPPASRSEGETGKTKIHRDKEGQNERQGEGQIENQRETEIVLETRRNRKRQTYI